MTSAHWKWLSLANVGFTGIKDTTCQTEALAKEQEKTHVNYVDSRERTK